MSIRSFINTYHEGLSISILSILYIVGLIQLTVFDNSHIIYLTPFLILINLLFLYIYTYEKRSQKLMVFTSLFMLGFGVEVLGVNTGFPFGDYQYGGVLGNKLWRTPWIIGANWVIVVVSSFQFVTRIFPLAPLILKSLCAGFIALGLDLFIEPVAIHYDMWIWSSSHVPITNYLAWLVISVIFSFFYGYLSKQRTHLVVIIILFWLFIFFGVLNLSI